MKKFIKSSLLVALVSSTLMAGKISNVTVGELMDGVGSTGLTFVSFCTNSACSTKTALKKINLPQDSVRYKRMFAALLTAKSSEANVDVWDNAGGWIAISIK